MDVVMGGGDTSPAAQDVLFYCRSNLNEVSVAHILLDMRGGGTILFCQRFHFGSKPIE